MYVFKVKNKKHHVVKPTLKGEIPYGLQINLKGDNVKIDKLKEIAKEKGIGASDIPDEFTADIIKTKTEKDEFGKTVLQVTMNIHALGETTVSYKPMHVEELVKSLQRINTDELAGTFKFKKVHFEIGFDRPMPLEKIVG